jgi:hypothetical protein
MFTCAVRAAVLTALLLDRVRRLPNTQRDAHTITRSVQATCCLDSLVLIATPHLLSSLHCSFPAQAKVQRLRLLRAAGVVFAKKKKKPDKSEKSEKSSSPSAKKAGTAAKTKKKAKS